MFASKRILSLENLGMKNVDSSLHNKVYNMSLLYILLSIIMGATLSQSITRVFTPRMIRRPWIEVKENMTLFDFTTMKDVDNWMEISDTVRTVGMSKAVLTLQKTQIFQRGIFFTLLNPQPNGAGFAGVRTPINWNLAEYRNIEMICRGQGSNDHYKFVIRHNGESSNEDISYEYFFTVPLSSEEMSIITCPLSDFKPYYRGRELPDAPSLNLTNITMFGLQIYGGVYSDIKQKGVSALEIEMIIARK